MNILKVISAFMSYPTSELQKSRREIISVIAACDELEDAAKQNLLGFVADYCVEDLLDLEAEYVSTFDRGRSTSLLLFEHVYGESRDRGQAMVDLLDFYRSSGYELTAKELPDYLPLFLEFLATQQREVTDDWLSQIGRITGLLAARLVEKQSRYAEPMIALLHIQGNAEVLEELRPTVAQEERDDTPEKLDEVWEEEAVRFGGNALMGGCPSQQPVSNIQEVQWVDRKQFTESAGGQA